MKPTAMKSKLYLGKKTISKLSKTKLSYVKGGEARTFRCGIILVPNTKGGFDVIPM